MMQHTQPLFLSKNHEKRLKFSPRRLSRELQEERFHTTEMQVAWTRNAVPKFVKQRRAERARKLSTQQFLYWSEYARGREGDEVPNLGNEFP